MILHVDYVLDFSYQKSQNIAVYNRKGSKKPGNAVKGVEGYGITPLYSHPTIHTRLRMSDGDCTNLDMYPAFKTALYPDSVTEYKVRSIMSYLCDNKVSFDLERDSSLQAWNFANLDARKILEEVD